MTSVTDASVVIRQESRIMLYSGGRGTRILKRLNGIIRVLRGLKGTTGNCNKIYQDNAISSTICSTPFPFLSYYPGPVVSILFSYHRERGSTYSVSKLSSSLQS